MRGRRKDRRGTYGHGDGTGRSISWRMGSIIRLHLYIRTALSISIQEQAFVDFDLGIYIMA